MISVDTKKKELVGRFEKPAASGGRPASPSRSTPTTSRTAWVRPSPTASTTSPPTAPGCPSASTTTPPCSRSRPSRTGGEGGVTRYPEAPRLLITADGGGSNGHRPRLWKLELARWPPTPAEITVCHYPPGTSKWNKIEHRLFSRITLNWRGRPLTSHEVVVETIAATTTRTGLTVAAELDPATYPAGIKITDRQMSDLNAPCAATISTATGTTASHRTGRTHPEISVLLIDRHLVSS